ncbi:Transamidase GatB domain protein [Bathymodiolus thermophilus thioautotrophic gill symbiont]|uniref:Glutamyl-tRNA amidotransferase n=1 Tax=Bathymodiolus thermophilus thioautotrophic gill symbiont TaxID=2360 RepID=A0A1J5U6Y5_9GAMM|nr:GatB/YqeY domain-containing protein [Bathymodiolus thermophilus thioautotrophic gill symbiont]OIR24574.1 glutamyl-tRNA amidotransferase [Bathymodiolus thermophilus thioautotrophic gill symbiont]SGZ62034.1 Transamidase GatB domain protein [Bathymodiolus thermophilus thioautotrophic gill symbiont]
MPELKNRITDDMKSAMKAKDKDALKAIRMILGAIKQIEVDERIELDDTQVLAVIQKMVKQRKDSISQFQAANRSDLVKVEEAELVIINNYMPEQFSEDEISVVVDKVIADSNASSMQDMGKLMGLLKGQLMGKADMAVVSKLIRSKLS